MSESPAVPPVIPGAPAAAPAKVLRRLFLTLFLRGRTSRGLQKQWAPRSVGAKLRLMLALYGFFGLFALAFKSQPVFALSVYMHAMTLVFLGMFVAASAGEILFNKEEADILLHRPVTPRAMLWAKIGVLVEVSLWLAGAFNLTALYVGVVAVDGGWLFPLAHAISTTMEALFCTGLVVVTYQLCLRLFGRERLEGLMTTAQVLVAIAAVLGGQIVPRVMFRFQEVTRFGMHTWWVAALPPAWFAGFDDALAGRRAAGSFALAAVAVAATAFVLWMAFGKLAADYQAGLQLIGETVSPPRKRRAGRRWLDTVANTPPLRWWLREPVSRAAFVLTAAYLVRDRDVKLRVYPGLAPMLIMPVIMLADRHGAGGSEFMLAMAGGWLGIVPLVALESLRYSQQWQAAEVFRCAPMAGPAPLCHGARRAVLFLLTVPLALVFVLSIWFFRRRGLELGVIIPELLALPLYGLVPAWMGSVPLSAPTEEAKAAGRGATMILVMFISMGLAGVAAWALAGGWLGWLIGVEAVVVFLLYVLIRMRLANVPWPAME
jgi:hypothetical protein